MERIESMNRILLIDDDTELRTALAEALRDAGFQVSEASDGAQGAAMQRRAPADAVVTDIFMPGQEGMETIFSLRSAYPDLKIVAISGGTATKGSYNFLPIAQKIGADRSLQKPFKAALLVSTLRELLSAKIVAR
jgi:DNA-binding response OmpR family regulator